MHTRSLSPALRHGLCGLLLLFILGGLLAQPAPTRADDNEADVAITIEAVPNLRVAPGTILAYKLRLRNYGDGHMEYAKVWLPYNPAQLTLVDTLFEGGGDYVEAIGPEEIRLHFSNLGNSTARFAVLYMYVSETLPVGTLLPMWGGFTWEDQVGNYVYRGRTNAAPVLIGEQNQATDFVWLAVDPPRAPAGTRFGFYTDRLLPGEETRVRLLAADGSEVRNSTPFNSVTLEGKLWMWLESDELAPGIYDYVITGRRSDLQAAVTFEVLPPQPAQP